MNRLKYVIKKLIKHMQNKSLFAYIICRLNRNILLARIIPDALYLECRYLLRTGEKLNLKNPQTFNEKLQWLKLYDRNPVYTQLVDKYEVRKSVAEKIGERHLIPLLGVWDSVGEIDFEKLPDQFVLKVTHSSGGVIVCKDKSCSNTEDIKRQLARRMKTPYFYSGREWPYKNIRPRIISEKYMIDESGTELKDYKFFCFNGEPKIIMVYFDRFTSLKCNLYDTQWNYIPISGNYPSDPDKIIDKPQKLDEMLDLAQTLSKDIPFVRVDLYSMHSSIYFGELTFYPASGCIKFIPKDFGLEMGNWLELPNIT